MIVIDRDDIISFFDQDRNIPIFALLEKHGFKKIGEKQGQRRGYVE